MQIFQSSRPKEERLSPLLGQCEALVDDENLGKKRRRRTVDWRSRGAGEDRAAIWLRSSGGEEEEEEHVNN